jgi:hypothetical protein
LGTLELVPNPPNGNDGNDQGNGAANEGIQESEFHFSLLGSVGRLQQPTVTVYRDGCRGPIHRKVEKSGMFLQWRDRESEGRESYRPTEETGPRDRLPEGTTVLQAEYTGCRAGCRLTS